MIDRGLRKNTFRPDIIEYNEYEMQASPCRLAESKNWTINIYIIKHRGSLIASKNFSSADSFPTREEAVKHWFHFGMKIIDGKIENPTVKDLQIGK